LLDETRAELVRADAKATTLFAVMGLAIGAVLAGIIGGRWDPTDLSLVREMLWWTGCGLAAFSIACLGTAIFPRTGKAASPGRARYFKEVHALKDEAAVQTAVREEADRQDGAFEREINQLFAVSGIVVTKYGLIRRALVLYGVALTSGITAVLV